VALIQKIGDFMNKQKCDPDEGDGDILPPAWLP